MAAFRKTFENLLVSFQRSFFSSVLISSGSHQDPKCQALAQLWCCVGFGNFGGPEFRGPRRSMPKRVTTSNSNIGKCFKFCSWTGAGTRIETRRPQEADSIILQIVYGTILDHGIVLPANQLNEEF